MDSELLDEIYINSKLDQLESLIWKEPKPEEPRKEQNNEH